MILIGFGELRLEFKKYAFENSNSESQMILEKDSYVIESNLLFFESIPLILLQSYANSIVNSNHITVSILSVIFLNVGKIAVKITNMLYSDTKSYIQDYNYNIDKNVVKINTISLSLEFLSYYFIYILTDFVCRFAPIITFLTVIHPKTDSNNSYDDLVEYISIVSVMVLFLFIYECCAFSYMTTEAEAEAEAGEKENEKDNEKDSRDRRSSTMRRESESKFSEIANKYKNSTGESMQSHEIYSSSSTRDGTPPAELQLNSESGTQSIGKKKNTLGVEEHVSPRHMPVSDSLTPKKVSLASVFGSKNKNENTNSNSNSNSNSNKNCLKNIWLKSIEYIIYVVPAIFSTTIYTFRLIGISYLDKKFLVYKNRYVVYHFGRLFLSLIFFIITLSLISYDDGLNGKNLGLIVILIVYIISLILNLKMGKYLYTCDLFVENKNNNSKQLKIYNKIIEWTEMFKSSIKTDNNKKNINDKVEKSRKKIGFIIVCIVVVMTIIGIIIVIATSDDDDNNDANDNIIINDSKVCQLISNHTQNN